jgi:hypothetical protein
MAELESARTITISTCVLQAEPTRASRTSARAQYLGIAYYVGMRVL